jgi:hypothetical protein
MNRNLFNIVFGRYGTWNTSVLIKDNGDVFIDNELSDETFDGTFDESLTSFSKKVIKGKTGRQRLTIADRHMYKRAFELRLKI